MHHSLHLRNISRLPWTLRRKAIEAANGSLDSFTALCVASLEMPNEQHLLLLPVFYAALDVSDMPGIDEIDPQTFPFFSLNRIFIAVEALRKIPVIHPIALDDLWPRIWACIQLLQAAQKHTEDMLSADVTRISFFRTIEIFQDPEREGPIDTTDGVWILVGEAWEAILQREEVLCDDALYKLSRFIARAAFTPSNVEELIRGAGGPTQLASLIIQHLKLSIVDMEESIHLFSMIRLLIRADGVSPSLRSALLGCGVISVMTDAVSTLGSGTEELTGVKRYELLNHALCMLMGTMTGATGSIYPWILQSFRAGLLQVLMDITCRFSEPGVVQPLGRFLTKLLPSAMVDLALLTQAFESRVDLGVAMYSAALKTPRSPRCGNCFWNSSTSALEY
ncbi:MYND-type domain-containing protein [Mycena venus]|uniref:MYND-type domain-containing protein n=1 Tax=Mycena venus TaxID=2733690 RepID=A0A8H6YXM5_9AGAR|nr:MYND-type domain-containing protein [Mycena venus]